LKKYKYPPEGQEKALETVMAQCNKWADDDENVIAEPETHIVKMYPQLEEESEMMVAAEPFECYKWNRFDQNIIDFFGGDKTIIVGCYKGKKYLEWILSNHIYNVRLGKTKGSMEENKELFARTSLLILYELGKPNKLSAYRITSNKEVGKDELISLGYPNPKPRKRYLTFSIVPLDMDLRFLVNQHLIEKLIDINPDNAKGTPVFIKP
jgi:type I restriction enzyme R subunit